MSNASGASDFANIEIVRNRVVTPGPCVKIQGLFELDAYHSNGEHYAHRHAPNACTLEWIRDGFMQSMFGVDAATDGTAEKEPLTIETAAATSSVGAALAGLGNSPQITFNVTPAATQYAFWLEVGTAATSALGSHTYATNPLAPSTAWITADDKRKLWGSAAGIPQGQDGTAAGAGGDAADEDSYTMSNQLTSAGNDDRASWTMDSSGTASIQEAALVFSNLDTQGDNGGSGGSVAWNRLIARSTFTAVSLGADDILKVRYSYTLTVSDD